MTKECANPQQPSPWLSILVPVYNVERYLRQCLESIAVQMVDGVEVIVLDDVCTDGSMKVFTELQAQWPGYFKKLQHESNRGISAARNTLLGSAKGKYIWFVDSDDVLMPGAIAQMRSIAVGVAPDLVLFDYRKLRDVTKLKHHMRGEMHCRTFSGPAEQLLSDTSEQVRGLFDLGQMHVWSKISKRSLWMDGLSFPEGMYYEDMFASPRLAIKAKNCYYAPYVWIAYRQRDGSIMSKLSPKKLSGLSEALVGFPDEFTKSNYSPTAETRFSVSHIAARNFVGAARQLSKMKGVNYQEGARIYLSNLRRSTMVPVAELLRGYLRRGWIGKWAQLSFWLWRAQRPA